MCKNNCIGCTLDVRWLSLSHYCIHNFTCVQDLTLPLLCLLQWSNGCHQTLFQNYQLKYRHGYHVSLHSCLVCHHVAAPFLTYTQLIAKQVSVLCLAQCRLELLNACGSLISIHRRSQLSYYVGDSVTI